MKNQIKISCLLMILGWTNVSFSSETANALVSVAKVGAAIAVPTFCLLKAGVSGSLAYKGSYEIPFQIRVPKPTQGQIDDFRSINQTIQSNISSVKEINTQIEAMRRKISPVFIFGNIDAFYPIDVAWNAVAATHGVIYTPYGTRNEEDPDETRRELALEGRLAIEKQKRIGKLREACNNFANGKEQVADVYLNEEDTQKFKRKAIGWGITGTIIAGGVIKACCK